MTVARRTASVIVMATLAVTLAGCTTTTRNPPQIALASPTECAVDADYTRADEPSPFDTPLEALLEDQVQNDLIGAGVTDKQLDQLEEQAATVTNDPEAGPVTIGANGAVVVIVPSNGGWYVDSTNVPTAC